MTASERCKTKAALFALGRMVDNLVFEIYRACRYDAPVAAAKLGLELATVKMVVDDRRVETGQPGAANRE